MTNQPSPTTIRDYYRNASFRGRRISRLEEANLGPFHLDHATAWELGCNHIGVFIGGCTGLDAVIDCLRDLGQADAGARWVVVAATKKLGAVIAQRWDASDPDAWVSEKALTVPYPLGNLILATPESLRRIHGADCADLAGIVVVDTLCHIHRLRGIQRDSFFLNHDRPQLIADFRNSIAHGTWRPPLVLMTQKPAKSVETSPIARAYCLEAWWFVNGSSVRVRPMPTADCEAQTRLAPQAYADEGDRAFFAPGEGRPDGGQ